jgi:hypothetical protein
MRKSGCGVFGARPSDGDDGARDWPFVRAVRRERDRRAPVVGGADGLLHFVVAGVSNPPWSSAVTVTGADTVAVAPSSSVTVSTTV